MSALKFKTPETAMNEKRKVEALIGRLNELLAKDPKAAKKAALILESWINKKK